MMWFEELALTNAVDNVIDMQLNRLAYMYDYNALNEKYNSLEQKYWDSQRLIDRYDHDYKILGKLKRFWKKRYLEAADELAARDEIILENIRLKNELTIERIKAKELKRYMEAYQHLYVIEVVKNNDLKKGEKDGD